MTRSMEFRMSRSGLCKPGDPVTLSESELRTLEGTMYYYTIEPALAMSNNTKKRLTNLSGVVTAVEPHSSEWTVVVDIEE